MNDKVRNYEPTKKAKLFTFSNGEKEYLILGGVAKEDLHEKERNAKAGFNSWLEKNSLIIPPYFRTNNEDLRVVIASQYDYQEAYNSMI